MSKTTEILRSGRELAKRSFVLGKYLFYSRKQISCVSTNLSLIDIEPVLGCNLRCRMCHVSFMKEPVKYLDIENINWEFCRDKTVTIGAVFEPFIHPRINSIIERLNNVGATLVIITNGHNLNKKEVPALFDSKIDTVTFSFDGIEKESYEEIRRGGNYDRTVANIRTFVANHKKSGTKFAVNYTVMQRNLSEIEDSVIFWEEVGVDLLRFIGMVVRENDNYLLDNNLFLVQELYEEKLLNALELVKKKDLNISIGNPKYRELFPLECHDGIYSNNKSSNFVSCHHKHEFDLNSPIGNGCSSPLTTARIDWNGNVFICHNLKIGNITKHDFYEIWDSRYANALRSNLIRDNKICNSCDYFKLCVNSQYFDTKSIDNYFSSDFKKKYPERWDRIKGNSLT